MPQGKLDEKKVRAFFIDSWFVKLEKAAFGWQMKDFETEVYGTESKITVSEYGVQETKTPLQDTYMVFIRPKGYAKGILFRLFELLSNIIAPLRRIGILLFLPLVILVGIMAVLCFTICSDPGSMQAIKDILPIIGIIYAFLIVPSLILALLGFIWRKIHKMDERADY